MITAQQVCALVALTVIKHRLGGKNPIGEADLEWIFARNLPCIRREAPGEVPVNVKVLNSHVYFKKYKVMRKFLMKMILIIILI